jgi:hypothetical protein
LLNSFVVAALAAAVAVSGVVVAAVAAQGAGKGLTQGAKLRSGTAHLGLDVAEAGRAAAAAPVAARKLSLQTGDLMAGLDVAEAGIHGAHRWASRWGWSLRMASRWAEAQPLRQAMFNHHP